MQEKQHLFMVYAQQTRTERELSHFDKGHLQKPGVTYFYTNTSRDIMLSKKENCKGLL